MRNIGSMMSCKTRPLSTFFQNWHTSISHVPRYCSVLHPDLCSHATQNLAFTASTILALHRGQSAYFWRMMSSAHPLQAHCIEHIVPRTEDIGD